MIVGAGLKPIRNIKNARTCVSYVRAFHHSCHTNIIHVIFPTHQLFIAPARQQ